MLKKKTTKKKVRKRSTPIKARSRSKVEDAQFWEALEKSCGNYAYAAKAISKLIGQTYTRQAARERALKDPAKLAQIKSRFVDIAEHTLLLAMTQRKNIPAAVSAAKFVASTKGKDRGYDTSSNLYLNPPKTIGDILDMAEDDDEAVDADEKDYSGESTKSQAKDKD